MAVHLISSAESSGFSKIEKRLKTRGQWLRSTENESADKISFLPFSDFYLLPSLYLFILRECSFYPGVWQMQTCIARFVMPEYTVYIFDTFFKRRF